MIDAWIGYKCGLLKRRFTRKDESLRGEVCVLIDSLNMEKQISGNIHRGLLPFDFIPKCIKGESLTKWPQFDKFPAAIEEANEFLAKNPHLAVFSCETVQFRFRQGVVREHTRSDFIQQEDWIKPFVMGLRIWTQPRQDSFDIPQRIGYVSCIPNMDDKETGGIDKLTADINSFLRANPLPGRIVSVGTVQIMTGSGQVDLDASSWEPVSSLANFSVALMTFVRIFYLFTAEIRHDEIGLADFFPAVLREGGLLSYPKLEPFPEVLSNLNRWANQLSSNIRLLNIQTLQVRAKKDGQHKAYNLFFWDSKYHEYQLRFLRAAYVITKDDPSIHPPSYFQRKISAKVFSPRMISEPGFINFAKFDPPEVLKDEIHLWVKKFEVNVIAVETLNFKVATGSEPKEGFDGMHTWNEMQTTSTGTTTTTQCKREQYAICFRVYFEGDDVPEPVDARGLPDFWRRHSGSCSIA